MFEKKKRYGQNFLFDPKIPQRMVQMSDIDKNVCALEIGPGMGILTASLAESAYKVVSVEIDEELIPILKKRFEDSANVKIINADIMQTDIKKLAEEEFGGMPVKVCANLPYYITSPVIMALLESGFPFKSITVMVQKEVASRLCAKSGDSDYSAFTAAVSYYATVKKLFNVPRGCFNPKPNVDSTVIRMDLMGVPPVSVKSKEKLFEIIKASFSARRKTLVNSLFSFYSGGISKEKIQQMVDVISEDPNVRGEQLSLKEFALLADMVFDAQNDAQNA